MASEVVGFDRWMDRSRVYKSSHMDGKAANLYNQMMRLLVQSLLNSDGKLFPHPLRHFRRLLNLIEVWQAHSCLSEPTISGGSHHRENSVSGLSHILVPAFQSAAPWFERNLRQPASYTSSNEWKLDRLKDFKVT